MGGLGSWGGTGPGPGLCLLKAGFLPWQHLLTHKQWKGYCLTPRGLKLRAQPCWREQSCCRLRPPKNLPAGLLQSGCAGGDGDPQDPGGASLLARSGFCSPPPKKRHRYEADRLRAAPLFWVAEGNETLVPWFTVDDAKFCICLAPDFLSLTFSTEKWVYQETQSLRRIAWH